VIKNTRFVQVDKNGGLFFQVLFRPQEQILIFVRSGETETGSAGEQPLKDSL